MIHTFTLDGVTYSYYPYSENKSNIDTLIPPFEAYKKSGYIDIGASFDIETTSYFSSKLEANRATMYHWQFALNKTVITGRTWDEFVEFAKILDKKAKKAKAKLLILDQNLGFEFTFIKGLFKWKKDKKGHPMIFAKDIRTVLYCVTGNLEFRDTLALTNMGLDKYKKNFNLDVGKLKGDLDYELIRHSGTPLTDRELAYCINDVLVLTDFYYKILRPEFLEKNKVIPLTSTGIVRSEVKDAFNEMSKEDQKKMRYEIRKAMPNREIYLLWRTFLFRGGLTHANILACNELMDKDFVSFDGKSMHPSQMLHHNFSWRYIRRNPDAFPEILESTASEKHGFFGLFTFYGIRSKTYHSLESKNKLVEYSRDAIFDNGRLCRAAKITVMLNQIDYQNYLKMYRWSSMELHYIYQSDMKPLPEYLLKTVCHYFWLKENCRDDVVLYNLTKRKLNGCFGMCSTGLCETDLDYDEETQTFHPSKLTRTYDELTRFLILLPQWAIEIAAYSRAQLIDAILNGGGVDSIYYDTDSNKVNHPEKHMKYYEDFNVKMREINRNLNTYGYDKAPFESIGCWCEEYRGLRYKVLGAKRYLVEHDGEIQCTVAGMVKGTLEDYVFDEQLKHIRNDIPEYLFGLKDLTQSIECIKSAYIREIYTYIEEQHKHPLIFDEFSNNLHLSPEYSKKKTTVYHDEPFEDDITDYLGQTAHISEKSCVSIISIPFHMSMDAYFLELIMQKKEEREREVYKGVL